MKYAFAFVLGLFSIQAFAQYGQSSALIKHSVKCKDQNNGHHLALEFEYKILTSSRASRFEMGEVSYKGAKASKTLKAAYESGTKDLMVLGETHDGLRFALDYDKPQRLENGSVQGIATLYIASVGLDYVSFNCYEVEDYQ